MKNISVRQPCADVTTYLMTAYMARKLIGGNCGSFLLTKYEVRSPRKFEPQIQGQATRM